MLNIINKLVIAICCLTIAHAGVQAQSLSICTGAAIVNDIFIRDKHEMTMKPSGKILLSPQYVIGFRYFTAQNFNLKLDATLGLSRFNMPDNYPNTYELYYEQVRSMITIGSGLYKEIDEDQSIMPYVELGTAFYDFSSMTQKTPAGYVGLISDYNSKHWVALVGAGFEYNFRLGLPSAINFKALYTPTNIFTSPVLYDVDGINNKGPYRLQGKLLQLMISYQFNIRLIKRSNY